MTKVEFINTCPDNEAAAQLVYTLMGIVQKNEART